MRPRHTVHPYAVAATDDAARRTRPPEGQAAVDDPEAARQALVAVLAAGPEVAEAALAVGTALSFDARSRDDWELNTLYMDHNAYVFHPGGDPSEGGPDFSGVYRGVEGYITSQKMFAESWSNLKVEAGPVKVLDESKALSMMHWSAQGTKSGMEMEWPATCLFEFRDGLLVDQRFWWSMDSARRDLGNAVPGDWWRP